MLRWAKRVLFGNSEREKEEEIEETLLTSKAELETLQRSIEQHCELIKSVDRALKRIKLKRQAMQYDVEAMILETYDVDSNNNVSLLSENVYSTDKQSGIDALSWEQEMESLRHHVQQEYKSISQCCDEEMAWTYGRLFQLRIALETLKVHKRELQNAITKGEEQYCTTMCQFNGTNLALIPNMQMEITYVTEPRSSNVVK